jgi:predicted exporter
MATIPKWELLKLPNKRLALGIWLLFLAACITIITRTQFRTDMGAFLPRSAPMAQQALTEQVTSGAASHLIMLAITGAPVPVLAAISTDMAQRLRQQPAFINIINGDEKSFADIQNFVWHNRYLLSPDVIAGRFTAPGLHAALVNDLALLGSDLGPMVQQTLPNDPTTEVMALARQFSGVKGPPVQDGVWLSANGARALLLVHTAAPGFNIDAQDQALTLINADFAQSRRTVPGASAASLNASGPGIFAIHTRDQTKRDVTRLSILATTGAILILAFAYRSPLVLVLGILPVASGALAAIAAVSLAFGFVHGITLGFGVTLIGESLDYAIYLFTQTARGDTAATTLARIWPTLRLGVLTSALGFSAMLFSSFVGFAQLGLFSIVGLIVAAAVTRFILPHLMPTGFYAPGADLLSRPITAALRHRTRLRFAIAGILLFSAAALLTHRGGTWDNNLQNLSPIPAADQALDQTLRQDLAVPDTSYFAVFTTPSEQQALQTSEALATILSTATSQSQLAGFDVPSNILPSEATQRARQAALPDATTLRTNFTQALTGLPFRPEAFAPFFADVATARTAPLITAANLPPALSLQLGTMLVPHGPGWVVMAPLRGVSDPAALTKALNASGISFVDLNTESDQLLKKFQREATLLATTGSLAILAVLLAGLRSLARVLTVAAPLAAAVLITAALLTLGGAKISIFMVVGFLLIVAVGSNYCLFFERAEPDEATSRRAVASIVLANLCTVSAYGLMAFSGIPVLHDIGRTVAIGTFLSLVCAAIFSRPGKAA